MKCKVCEKTVSHPSINSRDTLTCGKCRGLGITDIHKSRMKRYTCRGCKLVFPYTSRLPRIVCNDCKLLCIERNNKHTQYRLKTKRTIIRLGLPRCANLLIQSVPNIRFN